MIPEIALFALLIIVTGSFPFPIAPNVKADVATAAMFTAALVLDPGAAAIAGVISIVTYTYLTQFWGEKHQVPWYKYPFKAGQAALAVELSSATYHGLGPAPGEWSISPALIPAAVFLYLSNAWLVSMAVALQMRLNPISI